MTILSWWLFIGILVRTKGCQPEEISHLPDNVRCSFTKFSIFLRNETKWTLTETCMPDNCQKDMGNVAKALNIEQAEIKTIIPADLTPHLINFLFIAPFLAFVGVSIGITIYGSYRRSYKSLEDESLEANETKEGVQTWMNLRINLIELLQPPPPSQNKLAGFSFLKILASYWVLTFHAFLALDALGINVKSEEFWEPLVETMRSGGLIVEFFFMMTGFFAAYSLIPKLQKNPGLSLWILFKQRWIRIVPLLFFTYLFYEDVGPFLVTEHEAQKFFFLKTQQCSGQWWATLTLNGYYTKGGANGLGNCMTQIWYIPVDFLLYVAASANMKIYTKNRLWGKISAGTCILGSLIYRISSLSLILWPETAYFNYIINTPNFAHSCFSGVLWGIFYREYCENKTTSFLSKFEGRSYRLLLAGFLTHITVFFWWDKVTAWLPSLPIWGSIAVNLYVNSMALIIITMSINQDLWIQKVLSSQVFHILGKVSYSFYLFNDLGLWMITMAILLSKKKEVLTLNEVILAILGGLLFTQVVSLIWYILFEKPFTYLNIPKLSTILPCRK